VLPRGHAFNIFADASGARVSDRDFGDGNPQSHQHIFVKGPTPMAFSRKALTTGAVGVAALALIGTGAGATFTDAVHANRTVNAGTMNIQITSGGNISADHKSVTLSPVGPTGSTFESEHKIITITNNGDIPATADAFQMTESHVGTANNNALAAQTNVCIQSTDDSGGPWTEGNGPLGTAVALHPTVKENPVVLQPGQTMTFSVDFYAGQDSTQCNATSSDGSNTRAAWDGYDGGPYHTPASLTNAAQGGTITPTLTSSFTG
jgi:hypothetical protein